MVGRLIVHIGTHKTGSTAIQRSLAKSSDLLWRQGILYPEAGRGTHPGHPHLPWEVAGDHRFKPSLGGREALLEEVRKSDPATVIISSEEFCVPSLASTAARWVCMLGREIDADEVSVVCYVRPQWGYAESVYCQHIRGGVFSLRFREAIETRLYQELFDYVGVFTPWLDKFGSSFVVRPYRSDKLEGGDAVTDFWRQAALGEPPPGTVSMENIRLGRRGIEMLRCLRELLERYYFTRIMDVRDVFSRASSRLGEWMPEDAPFVGLTPILLEDLARRWDRTNRIFISQFLDESNADLFDPSFARTVEGNGWSLSEADEDEIRMFARLVEESAGLMRG